MPARCARRDCDGEGGDEKYFVMAGPDPATHPARVRAPE
jgi:hypothetical protein